MSDVTRVLLFNSDLILLVLYVLAIGAAVRCRHRSYVILGIILLLVLGVRHYLAAFYATLPIESYRFWWYQSWLYLFVGGLLLSVLAHNALFVQRGKWVKPIYLLMLVNVLAYGFMHVQRIELGINEPNWTFTAYTITVVTVNYMIAGLLLFGAVRENGYER
ncbi:hypothetical protein HMF8227_02343 [Saliniradius amylolyticus]|uniref:Uncharacterized protein n=1 Tax=Saliniradius amylolyticus TaxID=2183582 RepID=A0A2S2E565_9ALTE|nr:hypothetical protein [Saliniradius amylolyticus]AWL12795.1 hypothetical protein HMF8227_02343 [Saliniradius amylolyticus]